MDSYNGSDLHRRQPSQHLQSGSAHESRQLLSDFTHTHPNQRCSAADVPRTRRSHRASPSSLTPNGSSNHRRSQRLVPSAHLGSNPWHFPASPFLESSTMMNRNPEILFRIDEDKAQEEEINGETNLKNTRRGKRCIDKSRIFSTG